MRVLVDTSAAVARLVAQHPGHADARRWFQAAAGGRVQLAMALHGLAETWSVLTRLPCTPRIAVPRAGTMLRGLIGTVSVVPPTLDAYSDAMNRCEALDLRSGAIFDALHFVAARQVQADAVLTFNCGDFQRLCAGTPLRALSPAEPSP